jgi:hypothetical protein
MEDKTVETKVQSSMGGCLAFLILAPICLGFGAGLGVAFYRLILRLLGT